MPQENFEEYIWDNAPNPWLKVNHIEQRRLNVLSMTLYGNRWQGSSHGLLGNEILTWDKSPLKTKQSDGKAPVMLELWEIWTILSVTSVPGLLWPGVVALDRFLLMGQIELFDI